MASGPSEVGQQGFYVGAHTCDRRGRAAATGTARRLQGLDDLEEEPTIVEAPALVKWLASQIRCCCGRWRDIRGEFVLEIVYARRDFIQHSMNKYL